MIYIKHGSQDTQYFDTEIKKISIKYHMIKGFKVVTNFRLLEKKGFAWRHSKYMYIYTIAQKFQVALYVEILNT